MGCQGKQNKELGYLHIACIIRCRAGFRRDGESCTHKERTHEERDQADRVSAWSSNNVCGSGRSDASGSGWRPHTTVQSNDRMPSKSQVGQVTEVTCR
jgi:hypothetical protein